LHLSLSKELQLVKAFGELRLLDKFMLPADHTAFLTATKAYVTMHGRMDPALEVLAAWVRDPTAVQTMIRLSPGPSCTSAELLQVMHSCLRAISGKYKPELGACFQGIPGTGVSACFQQCGVAAQLACKAPVTATQAVVANVDANNLVFEVGSKSKTYQLLQARYSCTTQDPCK
jgi:hypothetical protein